jgi:hypothetical protein
MLAELTFISGHLGGASVACGSFGCRCVRRLKGASVKHLPAIFAMACFVVGSILAASYLVAQRPTGVIVDPQSRDLGTIEGQIVKCDLKITNREPYPVNLDIMKSCGCTSVTLEREQLRPGECTTAACDFDLRGAAGSFSSSVTVLYRRADAPSGVKTAPCFVFGTVNPIVRAVPDAVDLIAGRSERCTIRVSSARPNVQILRVTTDHAAFQAALREGTSQVDVVFDADRWLDAEGHGRLFIETNCEFARQIVVPLRVMRQTSVALREQ